MTDIVFSQSENLCLDPTNECVWRGAHAIRLTPKAFALLRYLVERQGQLVTKNELLKAVWPGIIVSENVLTTHVGTIRQALGDEAKTPRYIETLHRRGYRFVGRVVSNQHSVASSKEEVRDWRLETSSASPQQASSLKPLAPPIVGRETELIQLHHLFNKALTGVHQIVFVTGEPGIGKTALVHTFIEQLSSTTGLSLAWGHCVESYGAGEAYLPVLAALDALCRTSARDEVVMHLRQHAPMWLWQLPSLLTTTEREALQYQLMGATAQRMLRELANFLVALTATKPLVLVLEDLHWSDPSTVALLAYLARWQTQLRLLIIGTYRPVEVLRQHHPLSTVEQELVGGGLGTELPLPLLTETAVAEYLQQQVSYPAWPPNFARTVYQQTEGNPLFMVVIVEESLSQKSRPSPNGSEPIQLLPATMPVSVPERLRHLVTAQIERLPKAEQQLLEAASVAGVEFSTAEIAAAIAQDEVAVEEQCEHLARQQQFLRPMGLSEWPDGTVAARYGFRHAVYQALWQERVKAGRWQRYHYRIGERKERSYGERAKEIATELAVHFEQGHEYQRAVQYLQHVGENAIRKSAYREAISHLTKGLELLKIFPNTPERMQHELTLQLALGPLLSATMGYAAPEVGTTYSRALDLCRQLKETPQLFPILYGLCSFNIVRGKLQTARELGERLFRLAQNVQDRNLLLEAHELGVVLFYCGELVLARSHLEESIPFYDSQQHHALANIYGGVDPGVHCLSYTFVTLWLLGFPVQALKRSHEAFTLAQELSHPFSLAIALTWTAILHHFRREERTTQERAEVLITLSKEKGTAGGLTWGIALKGWALAEQGQGEEGIAQIRQGLANLRAGGREVGQMYFLALLAEALGKVEQLEEGLAVLAEALGFVYKTGECWYEAELHRLKGELLLQQFKVRSAKVQVEKSPRSKVQSPKSKNTDPRSLPPDSQAEAEACFLKAIAISRKQQAKSLELRATTSLARLWQQQGKTKQAHKVLSEVYNWFTEGFDTKDLQEAKALLDELSH